MWIRYILKGFLCLAFLSQGCTAINYFNMGRGELIDGNYEKAIEYLDIAISRDSDEAVYYFIRGIAYRSLMEYQKAIADFNRALKFERGKPFQWVGNIELYLGSSVIQLQRGITYREMGNYRRAILDFTHAIQEEPYQEFHKYDLEYYHRGVTYRIMGKLKRAIKDFNRAIQYNDELLPAHRMRDLTIRELNQEQKGK